MLTRLAAIRSQSSLKQIFYFPEIMMVWTIYQFLLFHGDNTGPLFFVEASDETLMRRRMITGGGDTDSKN